MTAADWLTSDDMTEALARIKQETLAKRRIRLGAGTGPTWWWRAGALVELLQHARKVRRHRGPGPSASFVAWYNQPLGGA